MSRISMAVLLKVRPSSSSSLSPLPSSSSSSSSSSPSSASLVELFYNSDFLDEERDGVQVSYNVLFHKRSRVENKFSIARITELLSFKESGSNNLRSNSSYEFKVPKTKCKTIGERAFARVGPSLWKTLPLVIRSIRSVQVSSRSSESIRAQWLWCCIFIFSKCTVCYVSNVCQLLSAF